MEVMTFKKAIKYCQNLGIIKEYQNRDSSLLELSNGEFMMFTSEYEGDWSDVTPGAGIQPPVCSLHKDKPCRGLNVWVELEYE